MSNRAHFLRFRLRVAAALTLGSALHACSSGDASVGSFSVPATTGGSSANVGGALSSGTSNAGGASGGALSGGTSNAGGANGGTLSGGADSSSGGKGGDSCPAGLDAPTPCTAPCGNPPPSCPSPCSSEGKACVDPFSNIVLCSGGSWRCPMPHQPQTCPTFCLPPPMSGNPPCGSRPCTSSERCCVLQQDTNDCSLSCVASSCLDQSCR